MKRLLRDPRYYQIGILSTLMTYGLIQLDLEIHVGRAAIILTSALVAQWTFTRLARLPAYDPKSALISGLSLCLLLRTNETTLVLTTVLLTIGSKFLLRVDGRHIFNPTNFGLVIMMLASDGVWVSPGQWGSGAVIAFCLACLGGLTIYRAARSDVTYAFLTFYIGILFGRALWLGDPLSIPFHQLENGAFLLFAFFMLSDPKTTPDSRPGRILFALLVALGGVYVQFLLFRPNGLLYSLVLFAVLTPLINYSLPGERYQWTRSRRLALSAVPERSLA